MKILFFGLCCDDDVFKKYIEINNNPYSVAHRLFENTIIDEMSKHNRITINHIFIWQGRSQKKIITGFQKLNEKVDSKILPYINIGFLKYFIIAISSFIISLVWNVKNIRVKERCMFSSINYLPVAFSNYIISKLFRIKNYIILTDTSLSNAYSNDNLVRNSPLFKRLLIKPYVYLLKFIESNYDGYVFLSQYMNEQINKKNHPWCLVEGIFNPSNLNFNTVKKEKAIMYAGTINYNLGIDILIDAFKTINDSSIQLWIFGHGDYVDDMKNKIKDDNRIKYMGFKSREEIFEYEKRASLLINTRNPKDEYTKLSFPSKTMEYMSSGTPFMTTKLLCYPKEYDNYLLYINDYTINEISKSIENFFSLSEKDQLLIGQKASNFIFNKKLKEHQVKKIIDLIL